jgi:lipopolysaccharide export system permease protein
LILLKKLDVYILKKFLTTFFFAILILAVIACVIDYSQKVDDFVMNKAPVSSIAFYFLNFIPHIIALLFPLFIFIATIFFTSKMAYRSEIIATLASGVSFQRFLYPYVVGSIILGVTSLVSNHWIVPLANQNIHDFHVKYIWSKKISTDANIHLRLSPDLYVFVENYSYTTNSGQRFTAETIDGTLLKEKIMADRITYDSTKKQWTLRNVWIRTNNGVQETLERKDSLVRQYAFTPDDLDDDDRNKEAMTTPELIKFADRELQRGRENVNSFLFEIHRRTTESAAGFILTIIAACISSRRIRGGSGLHLALGIVLSAFYLMFMQFSKTFSINSSLSPFIAAWIPNIIFGFIAIYLFRKQVR